MVHDPYTPDEVRRHAVLRSIKEVCCFRDWTLLAAHVRTNHVHAVVTADCIPEQVMIALKAYSSRELNRMAIDGARRRRWAQHASIRSLWTKEAVAAAVEYVIRGQGEVMSVFEAPSRR
jgi:REP element-mobilizing transposase RayT